MRFGYCTIPYRDFDKIAINCAALFRHTIPDFYLSAASLCIRACGVSSARSLSHLSLPPTAPHCIGGESCSLLCAVPAWNLVTHPDLGHLLTRSQRSASLRLKWLHPSREFPLRAAIIIADRHAKKLKWMLCTSGDLPTDCCHFQISLSCEMAMVGGCGPPLYF